MVYPTTCPTKIRKEEERKEGREVRRKEREEEKVNRTDIKQIIRW